MLAYGSPNYLALPSGTDALQAAVYLQQGVTAPVAYDFANTRYLLNFGVDLLEGWGAPVAIMRAFGRWRESDNGRRSKFVHIEPRMSVTASRADEWISLRPGTEAALALGIAYVLITEGLYDQEFVRNHTFGFEDWHDENGVSHMGFRSLVVGEYRLNDVAAITGVPAETILRIGREFGRNRPALAIGDHQTSTLAGSPYAAMAVHSLNAMLGSIGTAGGVLVQQEMPTATDDAALAAKLRQPGIATSADPALTMTPFARLPEAILSGKPYGVRALLLHDANPVFSQPNGEAFRRAFEQIPFIVSFASFLDESSAMADLVLPASVGLERWQDAGTPPGFANAVLSLSPPAVKARHDTRHPGDVVLGLARALGDSTALPFASFEEFLRHEVAGLFAAQSGLVFSPGLEENWARLLERSGWWPASYTSADELWKQMGERGGWWEPNYYFGEWERVVQTPSGHFEFYSQRLAQWAKKHPDAAGAAAVKANDDHSFLPHQPAVTEVAKDFPLVLLPFEILPLSGGEGAHLPYLQQIAGVHLFEKWESWLEINPETAHKLGINDGDLVWVESRRGRAQVRARLYAGVHPETVHMPLGYGRTQGSAWACRGVNPLELMEEQNDPLTGLAQTGGTAVKVYRA
jgi:anaerobic selenocysteine-containing dehydrogenase